MKLEKINNKLLKNICKLAIENKEDLEKNGKINKDNIEILSNVLKDNNLISEMEKFCIAIDEALVIDSITPLYIFNMYLINKILSILECRIISE